MSEVYTRPSPRLCPRCVLVTGQVREVLVVSLGESRLHRVEIQPMSPRLAQIAVYYLNVDQLASPRQVHATLKPIALSLSLIGSASYRRPGSSTRLSSRDSFWHLDEAPQS